MSRYKRSNALSMRNKIIKSIRFLNLSAKSTAMPTIKVTLTNTPNKQPIITEQLSNGGTRLVGWFNWKEGVYIADEFIPDYAGLSALSELQLYILNAIEAAIKEKLAELKNLNQKDEKKFKEKYKSYDTISSYLWRVIEEPYDLFVDINRQIKGIAPSSNPMPNEYIGYADDDPLRDNKLVTDRLPFINPANRHCRYREKRIVEPFLNTFFDKENKEIFSWYMGAVVLNVPLQDQHISRYLVISSKNGGVGKSTLMELLINGILTKNFATVMGDFDSCFDVSNRFAEATIPPTRLVVYSESNFRGSAVKDEDLHDFSGLAVNQIKALATEGTLNVEEKFRRARLHQFTNLHVILTNFPPQISKTRSDLDRRFISCIMKPTDMATEKSKRLGNKSRHELASWIHENAQAFLDYFADSYRNNPDLLCGATYNTNEVEDSTQEAVNKESEQSGKVSDVIKSRDGLVAVCLLAKQYGISYDRFKQDCLNAIGNPTNNIRWKTDKATGRTTLYINKAKKFWMNYGFIGVRDELIDLFHPVKKFGANMIPLEITEDYTAIIKAKNNDDKQ